MKDLSTRVAEEAGNWTAIIFIAVIVVGGIWGWIWNVVKIVSTISEPIAGMFLFRLLGVLVAPLGAIVGWF